MICWAIESYPFLLKVESVMDMHVVGDLGPWGLLHQIHYHIVFSLIRKSDVWSWCCQMQFGPWIKMVNHI